VLKKPSLFGEHLRELRESRGMSPADLAEQCGMPVEAVQMIEAGTIKPNGNVMLRFAHVFEVSLQALLLGMNDTGGAVLTAIKPKPWGGLEVCQFCDTSYHPMMRWSLGSTRITVCHDKACQDKAWEAGFEQRPDLTPKR
jgi:transcriptional regulator with XRE-family HTH domain